MKKHILILSFTALLLGVNFGITPVYASAVGFSSVPEQAHISADTPATPDEVLKNATSADQHDLKCATAANDGDGRALILCFAQKILGYLLGISSLIMVLMIIVSGLMYTSSAGDSKKVETAKKALSGAIIGGVIAMMSYALVAYTNNLILNGATPATSNPAPTPTPSGDGGTPVDQHLPGTTGVDIGSPVTPATGGVNLGSPVTDPNFRQNPDVNNTGTGSGTTLPTNEPTPTVPNQI
ncbi:MAG: pilin [Patescibacteria group bacterium]